MRAVLAAVFALAVAGLQVKDDDNDAPSDEDTTQAGVVSALDPELTNSALEKFHVSVPGSYTMIGMPADADPGSPETSQLMVNADFAKLTSEKCEDVMIRKITVQGTKLKTNLTKMEFSIVSDTFNTTDALGLGIIKVRDGQTTTLSDMTLVDFSNNTDCLWYKPKGYVKAPTKHSYRQRSRIYMAECTLVDTDPANNVIIMVHLSTVWRGETTSGQPIYANDLSFSISNVKKDSIGLLGTDSHDAATAAVQGCNKAQPVSGPFQTRKAGPKHPKKWR